MHLIQVSRWILRRALFSPIGWLWMAASLSSMPLLRVLTPGGILGHGEGQAILLYQVAFISSIGGATLALDALAENAWLLRRCAVTTRLHSQWTGVGTGALFGSALVVLGSLVGDGASLAKGGTFLAIALSSLHLAALGGLILQLPRKALNPAIALPLAAWILPSLLTARGVAVEHLSSILSAHRDPILLRDSGPIAFLASSGPIIALGVGVLLFVSGRSRATPIPQ